jgi:hypothetical protein
VLTPPHRAAPQAVAALRREVGRWGLSDAASAAIYGARPAVDRAGLLTLAFDRQRLEAWAAAGLGATRQFSRADWRLVQVRVLRRHPPPR